MNKREYGNRGEKRVCGYLESIGIKVKERNFNTRFGEIDIIAEDGDTIVFVEVKTRTNLNYGYPAESVTLKKQQKLVKTAKEYVLRNNLTDWDFRFDIAEVIKLNNTYNVNLIKNAFEVNDGI